MRTLSYLTLWLGKLYLVYSTYNSSVYSRRNSTFHDKWVLLTLSEDLFSWWLKSACSHARLYNLPLVGNSTSISKGSMVLWKRFHKDRSKCFCVIIMSLQLLSLTISLQLLGGKIQLNCMAALQLRISLLPIILWISTLHI